jgi:ABC-type dipeptide/oligopeptide/nickel transport system permease subunit
VRSLGQWPLKAALLTLSLLVLVAVFADLIASEAPLVAHGHGSWVVLPAVVKPHGSAKTELVRAPERADFALFAPIRPGPGHPLGTDAKGRDALTLVIKGSRTVVLTTFTVLVIAVALGTALGTLAGQGSPLPDALLARAVELTGALPTLVLLALLRTGGLLPSWLSFVLVLGALRTLEIARLVRGEVLRVGGTDFVLAARALGNSTRGIITRHVLPHVLGPLLVSAAFTAASVVALEAALDFVGLGLPEEAPSWGQLLGQVGSGVGSGALVAAASAVLVTTACLYVVADALDDRIAARRAAATRV